LRRTFKTLVGFPGFPAHGAKQVRVCGPGWPGPHEVRQRQQALQEIRVARLLRPRYAACSIICKIRYFWVLFAISGSAGADKGIEGVLFYREGNSQVWSGQGDIRFGGFRGGKAVGEGGLAEARVRRRVSHRAGSELGLGGRPTARRGGQANLLPVQGRGLAAGRWLWPAAGQARRPCRFAVGCSQGRISSSKGRLDGRG
jgi:hypothetical protein